MNTTTLRLPVRLTARRPSLLQRVWNALVAAGERRAAGELERLALMRASYDPAGAARLREAARYSATR